MNGKVFSPGNFTNRINLGSEYTDEQIVWLRAIDRYKRTQRRPYPTGAEILAIAHSLGYRKTAPAGPLPTFDPREAVPS